MDPPGAERSGSGASDQDRSDHTAAAVAAVAVAVRGAFGLSRAAAVARASVGPGGGPGRLGDVCGLVPLVRAAALGDRSAVQRHAAAVAATLARPAGLAESRSVGRLLDLIQRLDKREEALVSIREQTLAHIQRQDRQKQALMRMRAAAAASAAAATAAGPAGSGSRGHAGARPRSQRASLLHGPHASSVAAPRGEGHGGSLVGSRPPPHVSPAPLILSVSRLAASLLGCMLARLRVRALAERLASLCD